MVIFVDATLLRTMFQCQRLNSRVLQLATFPLVSSGTGKSCDHGNDAGGWGRGGSLRNER